MNYRARAPVRLLTLSSTFAPLQWVYVYWTNANGMLISRFKHMENSGGLTSRANVSSQQLVRFFELCLPTGDVGF